MDKTTFKYKSNLFGKELTLTIDEELNKLKGKVHAPKKLEQANKALKGLKVGLPQ